MKVIAPVATQDVASAKAQSGNAYALQWRKALEQAQWQAQQHTSPNANGETGSPRGSAAGCAAAKLASLRSPQANDPPMASSGPSASAQRIEALATAILLAVAPKASPIDAPTDHSALAAGAAGKQDVAAPATTGPASEAEPPTALPSRFEVPEWPDVVVQASTQGSTISVVMRDQSLQEEDAVDLYHRLREKLRAAGFELGSLTVNGQNINAADVAASGNA